MTGTLLCLAIISAVCLQRSKSLEITRSISSLCRRFAAFSACSLPSSERLFMLWPWIILFSFSSVMPCRTMMSFIIVTLAIFLELDRRGKESQQSDKHPDLAELRAVLCRRYYGRYERD